jgi:two-component system chemotaxis response regulator CheY
MSKRVVIVDDTAFMRLTLKNMLTSFGYEVVGEGSDGFDAVSLYKRLKPDIITMDITMPKKDGIEAVKEILSFDPKARVIMVSAMGQKNKVMDAVTAGAKDFIVKPFKPERIDEALARIEGREPSSEIQVDKDKQ